MNRRPTVLVDNGHGEETPGKRSPDGTLKEWEWTREIARRIVDELNKTRKVEAMLLTPENRDVKLTERVRRANVITHRYGADNVILVSVHVNAAGADGQWHEARGWSGWVAKKASANSRTLAKLLMDEAEKHKLTGNRYIPRERYWTANFYIVKHTACPAVLTENLFQDNRSDVRYLLSEEGKEAIVRLHVDAILKYIA